MDKLPAELLALISCQYLTSKIDILSFLASHPRHFQSFRDFAPVTFRVRFCQEFKLDNLGMDFSHFGKLYSGLQGLKGSGDAKILPFS